jgi:hypothetical protein
MPTSIPSTKQIHARGKLDDASRFRHQTYEGFGRDNRRALVLERASVAKRTQLMNDEFDSHGYTPGERGARPVDRSAQASTARGSTFLKAMRTAPKVGATLLAHLRVHRAWAFLRRHWAFAVFFALVLFPLAGMLLGYLSRPGPGSVSQTASGIATSPDTSAKQAKPAPGKERLPVSQAPPPAVAHAAPSTALETQSPPSMSVPARPLSTPAPAMPNAAPNTPAPPPAANVPYTPMVYSARHDKVFGQGCAGQLTLDTSGLAFRCPDDPGSSLQFPLADIASVDGNGVRLNSGKKYHFSIAGMGRSNAEQLFANWLSRVK